MKMKPMEMDNDKYIYIGCIPVEAQPDRPTDQSFCIKRDCPHCNKPMWVSEKKRLLEETMKIPKEAKIYCLECLVIASLNIGIEPVIMDIGAII